MSDRVETRTYAHLRHDEQTAAALALAWLVLGPLGVAWCVAREAAFRVRRWLG